MRKWSATEIREAVTAYNAAYPEAAAEIATGVPTIRVIIAENVKSYSTLVLKLHVGVVAPDGGFIGGGPETFESLRMRRPRYPAVKAALWFGRKAAGEGVALEVYYHQAITGEAIAVA